MNTLIHPATSFVQSLRFTEVAYKDMTPLQQDALWRYMDCGGDGVWAYWCKSKEKAIELYGDVRFGIGRFANNDTMKIAFVEATDDADTDNPLEWFAAEIECERSNDGEALPVIMSNVDLAPEFGLFEWGYEWFYLYWARQPETEFIIFLPNWDTRDNTGRGGQ